MRLFGRRLFGVPAFVALVLAWASSFSVIKVGLEYAPPVLSVGMRTLPAGLVEPWGAVSWKGPLFASVLYSALIGTGLAWLLFFGLVRSGEASRVASYIFVVPLAAVVTGAVFPGETLRFPLLVGAGLVVSGVCLANRTPRGARKAPG